jgi:D-tyrosyl-tRNA(Tyr) deacylase
MKAVLQRVGFARVRVAGEVVGEIGPGLLVLACALRGDRAAEAQLLAEKIAGYRIFEDPAGRMNLSARDLQRPVLLVSQFTLAADGRRGRRPSFDAALEPAAARARLEELAAALRGQGLAVAEGHFGAHMEVELLNAGPATFLLDCPPPAGA